MVERRKYERHRTLKAGRIVFNHRSSVIDCTVRNLSPAGACLHVADVFGIPNTFSLEIGPEHIVWPCQVIWRTDKKLGVSFDQASAAAAPHDTISAA